MIQSLLAAAALFAPADARPDDSRAEVSYRLTLVREPVLRLQVEVEALADSYGETAFEVTRGWGGVDAAGADLVEPRAWGEDGSELAVERPEPWRFVVRHGSQERVRFAYAIPANDNQADSSPRVHYRPIVTPKLVHLIGELALARPTHLDDAAPRPIAFEWDGFAQAGLEVACSVTAGSDGGVVARPLEALHGSLFVAGEIAVFERSLDGAPLVVAIAGTDWGFAPEEFADLAERVVGLERAFFGDVDRPPYLVCLIPVGKRDDGSRSLGGTGLSNAFATFSTPAIGLAAESGGGFGLPQLLIHEMFHEWNGRAVGREAPEEVLYWFSEGFTDFYTRRLALRGGWIDAAGYAADLSAKLAEYAASPERNATAERLQELFWTDRDAQRQPYVRGDLLACLVDGAIRARTNGEQSLDDLMRELVREARSRPSGTMNVSAQTLLERIERWAGPETAARVRAVAVDGETLELPLDLFGPALVGVRASFEPFDLGFDLDASQRDDVVRGVREGSAAWKAGLRDGQTLAGVSVWHGRTDRDAEIGVSEDGARRVIRFRPVGPPMPVQQFRAAPEANGAALRVL